MHAIKGLMLMMLASRVMAAPGIELQGTSIPAATMPVKAEPRSDAGKGAGDDTQQDSAARACALSKVAAAFQLGKSNAAKSTCAGSYVVSMH